MAKRKTTEEFIADAKRIHGDRYDYSLVENYKTGDDRILIKCIKHDFVFDIVAKGHLRGNGGCKHCALEIRISKQRKDPSEFLEQIIKKHNNYYDYSKVIYLNHKLPIEVICKKHGSFEIVAGEHLRGSGCKQCGIETYSKKNTKTTEVFIRDAKKVYGDLYNYSKSEYVGSLNKITITCKKHGDFEVISSEHLRGRGCQKCGYENISLKNTKPFSHFLEVSIAKHGNIYTYYDYISTAHQVKIKCNICNNIFYQNAANHMNGTGCPKCAIVSAKEKRSLSTEHFIKKAIKIHNNKFSYDDSNYIDVHTPLLIKCNNCNNTFEKKPEVFYGIKSCPICQPPITGFNRNKKAILYYLKVVTDVGIFYKIGITNRTVEERYCSEDLAKIEIINIIKYKNGGDCYDAEQNILKEYFQYRYVGSKILKSCGDTELFTKDVLGLDV